MVRGLVDDGLCVGHVDAVDGQTDGRAALVEISGQEGVDEVGQAKLRGGDV